MPGDDGDTVRLGSGSIHGFHRDMKATVRCILRTQEGQSIDEVGFTSRGGTFLQLRATVVAAGWIMPLYENFHVTIK
jgi:hypothetical protein